MSINVYLTDKIAELPGFKTETRQDKGRKWEEYMLPGIGLYRERGRWFTTLYHLTDPVPEQVAELVEEISYRDFFPAYADREPGIYEYKSAVAEVDHDQIGARDKFKVHIEAKNMKDLNELCQMIRIGSARPQKSFRGPQSGLSRKELEEKVKTLTDEVQFLFDAHAEALGKLDKARQRLGQVRGYILGLEYFRWPFISTMRVHADIGRILNDRID